MLANNENDKNFHSKIVDVRLNSRPIKIAFIVPANESRESNWILDAVFHDSYCRWGGAKTLLIPHYKEIGIYEIYYDWILEYEPDLIYSYVDLNDSLIKNLQRDVLPISIICHETRDGVEHWRQFLPSWPYGIEPAMAISTVNSPHSNYLGWSKKSQRNIYITQNYAVDDFRFLPDNFGVSHHRNIVTNEVLGCYETLCYCPEDTSEQLNVGSERVHNICDILDKIANKDAKTFLQLSSIYSSRLSHPKEYLWSTAFHLYIGESTVDRINFWNSRLISSRSNNFEFDSLIISEELIYDENFITSLGCFLNVHNYKSYNSGNNLVNIRSHSKSKECCEHLALNLQKHTHSRVSVPEDFDYLAIPSKNSLDNFFIFSGDSDYSFKMRDANHVIRVEEPFHFDYLPAELKNYKEGQYAVEIKVERPLSNYSVSGGFNDWILPRRTEATRPFVNEYSKPTKHGSILAIPSSSISKMTTNLKINLSSPSVEEIFKSLIIDNPFYRFSDARKVLNENVNKYKKLALSDKGKKHRGIISLFNFDLGSAGMLTNRFWREFLRDSSSNDEKAYTIEHFDTKINQYDLKELEHITRAMRFSNVGETKKYLKENLRDAIEYLIKINVLIQQYKWRCDYCGNRNIFNLDTIKSVNKCSVCSSSHSTPIDMCWEYRFSPFVISSLCEHNGLTVLWAISFLLDGFKYAQSIYLPEVDLYFERDGLDKNEIDLLAIIKGDFCAAEVKRSAASFVENEGEIESFIDEANRLQTDIMYLIFEQYCENEDEIEKYKAIVESTAKKINERIPDSTKLKVIVANEIANFSSVPIEIGPYGDRTHEYLSKFDA